MRKISDSLEHHQLLFGLLGGALLLSVTIYVIALSFAACETPAYAASADIKGSPHVAIAAFPTASSRHGEIDILVAYSDGHVGPPPEGTETFMPALTGGSLAVDSGARRWVLGTDNQLYEMDAQGPSAGQWVYRGCMLP